MTKERYLKIRERLSAPAFKTTIIVLDRVISIGMAVAYLGMLAYLLYLESKVLPIVVVAPLVYVLILSTLRSMLNFPRPYEVWGIDPIIPREKKGKSFPSRHVGCAAIISMAFIRVVGLWGLFGIFFTILLASLRVVGGVHFTKDVVVAAASGFLIGSVMLFL